MSLRAEYSDEGVLGRVRVSVGEEAQVTPDLALVLYLEEETVVWYLTRCPLGYRGGHLWFPPGTRGVAGACVESCWQVPLTVWRNTAGFGWPSALHSSDCNLTAQEPMAVEVKPHEMIDADSMSCKNGWPMRPSLLRCQTRRFKVDYHLDDVGFFAWITEMQHAVLWRGLWQAKNERFEPEGSGARDRGAAVAARSHSARHVVRRVLEPTLPWYSQDLGGPQVRIGSGGLRTPVTSTS